MNNSRSMAMSNSLVISEFLRKVYLWMTLGLFLTGFVAKYISSDPAISSMIFGNKSTFILVFIVQIGLVMALSFAINKISATVATLLFMLYSIATGVTLSVIFLAYPMQSIINAFFITAGTFFAMTIYGTITKRDLTRVGSFLTMGLFGIIIAMFANFFFKSQMLDFAISCIGVVVFTGLTAYDTQRLIKIAESINKNDTLSMKRAVIMGALTLYLDFINLFLMILKLTGGRRN